jgi:hypothetical protein
VVVCARGMVEFVLRMLADSGYIDRCALKLIDLGHGYIFDENCDHLENWFIAQKLKYLNS